MTREAFIRKWLANKDFQYCEDGRAQMREDLYKVIDYAQQKLNIASVVRPEVEGAKEGELLPESVGEANKRAGFWCQNEMYGNVKCDVVCKHCKGYGG